MVCLTGSLAISSAVVSMRSEHCSCSLVRCEGRGAPAGGGENGAIGW